MILSLLLQSLLLVAYQSPHCRIVRDSDKHGFDEVGPIKIDVDGDGKLDTITPHTFSVKNNRAIADSTKSKIREWHWISFDLKTSKGQTIRSFFKYRYGTDDADYWAYALIPCKINKDGKLYLEFYAGDDTSDETIILVRIGNRFKVLSRKRSEWEM